MKKYIFSVSIITGLFFYTCYACAAVTEKLPKYDGIIEPNEVINIGSPVRGLVEKVFTERSNMVKKGDILVQLEASVERAMVKRARVLAETTGEIQLQQEKHAFAHRALKRVQELFSTESISTQAKDKAETDEAVARFTLQKAQEAKLLAQLDLKHAEALLALRTIRSPISGVVVERFISRGEFIDEQPLMKIAEINPLKVEVIVPAEILGTILPGNKARVIIGTHFSQEIIATVTVVDKVIDAASNTFGIRLKLKNPGYHLAGGLSCQVQFLPPGDQFVPEKQTEVAPEEDDQEIKQNNSAFLAFQNLDKE